MGQNVKHTFDYEAVHQNLPWATKQNITIQMVMNQSIQQNLGFETEPKPLT